MIELIESLNESDKGLIIQMFHAETITVIDTGTGREEYHIDCNARPAVCFDCPLSPESRCVVGYNGSKDMAEHFIKNMIESRQQSHPEEFL